MTHGRPINLGTRLHGTHGTVHSTPQSIGARILGTTVAGTHLGIMTLGTMDILGDGAIHGITADGTIHGTGILGTTAVGTVAGMEAGTADGMIRGTMEDGDMARITFTTTTSSVRAVAESILRVCPQPALAEEAESVHLQGAQVLEVLQ